MVSLARLKRLPVRQTMGGVQPAFPLHEIEPRARAVPSERRLLVAFSSSESAGNMNPPTHRSKSQLVLRPGCGSQLRLPSYLPLSRLSDNDGLHIP